MNRLDREETGASGDASETPGPSRRRFRLRFREFLLFVALASILAATVAVRLRTVRVAEAEDHLTAAHWVRWSAQGWKDRMEREEKRLGEWPNITEEWLAGCGVRLLPTDRPPRSFAATGKTLAVALELYHAPSIWIGVFDEEGKLILEHSDASREMHALLGRLARPETAVELTGADKQATVDLVAAIFARYEHDLQEDLKTTRARLAHEITEAERHEREAGMR
jgi:hypothetical protein